jgi:ribosome-associated protein
MEVDQEPLVSQILEGIRTVKGHEIVLMDLRKITQSVCDYFVVCTGDSSTQLDALYDSIVEKVAELVGEKPLYSEGRNNKEWIIVDYENVVVHIFHREVRSRYNLEDLWGDAQISEYLD